MTMWKEKELNFDRVSFFLHLSLLFSGQCLNYWFVEEATRVHCSLCQSQTIVYHDSALFFRQASFWPKANYISESRMEKNVGQERIKCWQVLLGSLNIYPQEISFLLIGLLANSGLAQALHYRRHDREAFLISDGSEMVGFLHACHLTEVFDLLDAAFNLTDSQPCFIPHPYETLDNVLKLQVFQTVIL